MFGQAGKEGSRWDYNKAAAIGVTGRHIINIWRAMKSELNLLGHKMENVVYHLLNRRSDPPHSKAFDHVDAET
jgi:DNA polymerase zeta